MPRFKPPSSASLIGAGWDRGNYIVDVECGRLYRFYFRDGRLATVRRWVLYQGGYYQMARAIPEAAKAVALAEHARRPMP